MEIKVPPRDELDEYEKELLDSADPADRAALLVRIALREAGVDPDSDKWWITGHKVVHHKECPHLKVEPVKLFYRPRISVPYTMNPPEGYRFKHEIKLEKDDDICRRCDRYYEEPLHHPHCVMDGGATVAQWTIEGDGAEDGCMWNPSRFKPR